MELDTYDLEAIYDAQIAPLMTKIIAICVEHDMPMLASFAYAQSLDRSSFCTTAILPEDRAPIEYTRALSVIKPA